MSENTVLRGAYQGFREDFLDYQALTQQLRAWAETFPELAHLQSLGASPEGRELWLLTIGTDPERARPAVWIDANLHASELCGTNVALGIAEDLLAMHLGQAPAQHPAHLVEKLCDVLFYIMPRISPDGAEAVLTTGRYLRSTPRDTRPQQQHSHWRSHDQDGDGLALLMRVADVSGDFVESDEVPGVMLARRLEDPPPYYKLYPEGSIENFDGTTIPDPQPLSDNEHDLNRNFPYAWAPEPKQAGAGAFPASEPESRAVVEFASKHPTIFAWMSLHTFGGVFIRPLADKPDAHMNASDLAVYRQVGAWAEEVTGYPMVSGFTDFTYQVDTPIHGSLGQYAYSQRGCLSYVVELWDLFAQIGAKAHARFVDHYSHLERDEIVALAKWDREHNQGRVLRPWVAHEHPQLGAVEVGGIDPRFGLWNPPKERLAEICQQQSDCFLKVAALGPRLDVQLHSVTHLADDLRLVRIAITNTGYLPTHILESAKELPISEPLAIEFLPAEVELADPNQLRQGIGQLAGWGRGLYDDGSALFFARSRGNHSQAQVSVTVRGSGSLKVRVGSCRVGWLEASLAIA